MMEKVLFILWLAILSCGSGIYWSWAKGLTMEPISRNKRRVVVIMAIGILGAWVVTVPQIVWFIA